MYVQYGSGRLPKDSTKVERAVTYISPAGVPIFSQHRWALTTVLNPDNVGGTTAEQIAGNYAVTTEQIFALFARRNLELAVYTDGGRKVMSLPPVVPGSGGTGPTPEFLANPVGDGTEFAGMRTLSFAVTATYPVADLSRVLVAFKETLQFRGTGQPAKLLRIGMAGSAIQYPKAASVCTAVQSGTAVGAIARPTWAVPGPLWAGTDYDGDQTGLVVSGGVRQGDSLTNFELSWQYNFSRVGKPFVGVPTEWR